MEEITQAPTSPYQRSSMKAAEEKQQPNVCSTETTPAPIMSRSSAATPSPAAYEAEETTEITPPSTTAAPVENAAFTAPSSTDSLGPERIAKRMADAV